MKKSIVRMFTCFMFIFIIHACNAAVACPVEFEVSQNSQTESESDLYIIQSVLDQITSKMSETNEEEEYVKCLTLLCYYGFYFGIGDYVDYITFATNDDLMWSSTRSNLASGYPGFLRPNGINNAPLILFEDLFIEEDSIETIENYNSDLSYNIANGYNVYLSDEWKNNKPLNVVEAVDGFFQYGRFSQWYYFPDYADFTYAFSGTLRDYQGE